jgi:hypothetical protein
MERRCIITDAEVRGVRALCGDARLWTAAKLRDAGFDLQRTISYHYDKIACTTTFAQTYIATKETEENESAFCASRAVSCA